MKKKESDIQHLTRLIKQSGITLTLRESKFIAQDVLSRSKGEKTLRALNKKLLLLEKQLLTTLEKQQQQKKSVVQLQKKLRTYEITLADHKIVATEAKKR